MTGAFRWILAVMVMLQHLSSRAFDNYTGSYAVFPFLMLLGYFGALGLRETYGITIRGTAAYLLNRAVRIYPLYYAVLSLCVVVAVWLPDSATEINPVLRLPDTAVSWLHNLAIFGLNQDLIRLVPTAWFLDIALTAYIGMSLLLARSRYIAYAWLVGSVAYAVYSLVAGLPYADRYYSLLGASLPVSMGVVYYYVQGAMPRLGRWHIALSLGLFGAWAAFSGLFWSGCKDYGFYPSLILAMYVLAAAQTWQTALPGWLKRLDSVMGDMAYAMFLCHWPVASLIVHFVFEGSEPDGAILFLTAMLPTVAVALLLVFVCRWSLDGLRKQVRRWATTT